MDGEVTRIGTNQQTKAFIVYLGSQGLKKDDRYTKKRLQDIYKSAYKRNKQLIPSVPPFSSIWYAFVRSQYISSQNGTVVFCEKTFRLIEKFKAGNATGTTVTRHEGSSATASGDLQPLSPQTSRGKVRVARLAVDQHVTRWDREESPVTDAASSDDQLPAEVKHQGNRGYLCEVCRKTCNNMRDMKQHLSSHRHRAGLLTKALRSNRDGLVRNKDDILVRSDFDTDKGQIELQIQENQKTVVEIEIENQSEAEALTLKHCERLRQVRVFSLDDTWKVTEGQTSHSLPPGDKYTIKLTALARNVGRFNFPVAFEFERPSAPGRKIHIVRHVVASCTNALIEDLLPKVPYRRPPRKAMAAGAAFVEEGEPLPGDPQPLEQVEKLGSHFIPGALRRLLNRDPSMHGSDTEEVQRVKGLQNETLSMENYAERFSLLLHLEEYQMEVDIRRYDMQNAAMEKCTENSRLLSLQVPGVAENRPSVLKGDCLYVRCHKADGKLEDTEYKGYVHQVRNEHLWLGFSQKLRGKFVANMKFSVRFTFNRLPLQLQHRAVQLAEEHSCGQLLFPSDHTVCKSKLNIALDQPLRLYDRKLEGNTQQRTAVQHIVAGSSRPAPYLVFGPPGTGKTVTIVEAMKQVLKLIEKAVILACAPSNSAVDLLTERLLSHVDKAEIFRMNALSRDWKAVPEAIKCCCNYDRYGSKFYYPSKAELSSKYRVITCTLVTAGRLASANFPAGHFTHVFVDECGQGLESESVIAVANVLDNITVAPHGGQLVLAGDPQQLGPVLRSPVAIKAGLGVSLLERLMNKVDVYQRRHDNQASPYDNRLLTKLLKNYRSHPDILRLPNKMFYDNELEACADQMFRECLCQWERLPKKGFPIVFHGVAGEDMREERSPSFFNPQEVNMVVKYVEELLQAKRAGIKLTEKHIGIISPYRRQVQKLQQVLKREHADIKVGSVEEFQGQERTVIIISTVRSNPDFLAMDVDFKLGFLKNPKRFNVAITRAKSLLIVVGNPSVLSQDPCWQQLLHYCKEKGAYMGEEFEEDPESSIEEDIIQRFAAMNLDESQLSASGPIEDLVQQINGLDVGESISAREHQEQPEWRADH